MSLTNTQIRARARESMLGHYGTVVFAVITGELIVWVLSMFFSFSDRTGILLVLSSLMALALTLLRNILRGGYDFLYLQLARDRQARVTDIFYCFRIHTDQSFRLAGLLVLVNLAVSAIPLLLYLFLVRLQNASGMGAVLLTVLFALLYAAGMLLVNALYSMSFLLLIDEPALGALGCMKRSREMTAPVLFRLAALYISFAGYWLLGLISLGLGFWWVYPYIGTAKVHFYLTLRDARPEL